MKIQYLLLSSLAINMSCSKTNDKQDAGKRLGELNHKFNISVEARQDFDDGLLLLHSFEYDDARVAFENAIEADSTELMAHWGVAMSHYKALWGLQDVDAGRAAMKKLGDTIEDRLTFANDDLESSFWRGVELLYGDGEFFERNKRYADHMAGLYEKYPGNHEVAAFYALALMWSVPNGRQAEVYDLSAKVAEGVLKENPNHPGALHYLIHANDDPDFAQFSKAAADLYSKVAPDATHALHMPSHIYLALGMWNDVVASNEASYGASVNKMEERKLDDKGRGYHSYAWLHYGYLQQGRFEKAAELMKDMQGYTANAQTQIARDYLIRMQTAQLIETGNWLNDVEPLMVDYSDLSLTTKSEKHFFNATMAYQNGNKKIIQQEIAEVENRIKEAELLVTEKGIAMCSAGTTRYAPTRGDIIKANVIVDQMKAYIAMLDVDDKSVERLLSDAVKLEESAPYSFGPPGIIFPSYEQYGEWLLSKNRTEEALTMFEKSLTSAKNRSKALRGKIKALKILNRVQEAEEAENTLKTFWNQVEMV